ncbi:MAG TPA: EAL domain-containing protein, partial [Paenisporosarcina sp.]|nr:EAL domain-containing protein [Paenisporosarcina sp.]
RWHSPELGQVPPDVFIPAAENSGKIRAIEQVILFKALTWLQNRKRMGKKILPVAINISTDHFFHPYFVADLRNTVKKFGIPSKYVRIEITESIGLVDFELAKNIFGQLKLAGFESSVDDFGMGFSSLSYLQQLPVSEIKIDRSFISKIENEGTLAIVRTIVQLAANLNMQSIAEGIETVEQLTILRTIGCNCGQGFYFYKPMSFDQMDIILDKKQH